MKEETRKYRLKTTSLKSGKVFLGSLVYPKERALEAINSFKVWNPKTDIELLLVSSYPKECEWNTDMDDMDVAVFADQVKLCEERWNNE